MKLSARSLSGDSAVVLICAAILWIPGRLSFRPEQDTIVQLAATTAIAAAAVMSLLWTKRKFTLNKSESFLMLLLGTIAAASLCSPHPAQIVRYGTALILGIFIIRKVSSASGNIRPLSVVLVLAGICEVVYGISRRGTAAFGAMGHFDNPAGFAAWIVALLPFAAGLIGSKSLPLKIFGTAALGLFLTGLFLSGSRAGLVAAAGSGSIGLFRFASGRFAALPRKFKWGIAALAMAGLIGGGTFLYFHKKDSADGRILIWKSCGDMIADKPLLGHGANSFKAEYMAYQGAYFEKHPDSRYGDLADNVKRPFNEYLGFLIQYGAIGILPMALLFFFVLKNGLRKMTGSKRTALWSLTGIGIFALFSYPLYYSILLIMISIDLSIVSGSEKSDRSVLKMPSWCLPVVLSPLVYLCCANSLKTIRDERTWSRLWRDYNLQGADGRILERYRNLYLKDGFSSPWFLYNYGAVLNREGRYRQSTLVLKDCERQINDADLQILQADNYFKCGNYAAAEACAGSASRMCPNRFIPLYQLVMIYDKTGRKKDAAELANEILKKPVKVQNTEIRKVKLKLRKRISQAEN